MGVREALKVRWKPEYDKHEIAVAARKDFHHVLDAHATLETKRAELNVNPDLSQPGRDKALATAAAAEAKRVTKAQSFVAMARAKMREDRIALTPTVSSKSNAAAAALRQEVRAGLKGMSRAEIATLVSDPHCDAIVLEALFEGPTFLTGIDAITRGQLLAMVVERTAGPAVAALAEQSEALDLLDTATRMASDALRAASGAVDFQKWLAEVAPADTEAEAVAFNAERVTQGALGLPLPARMSLVDQLLESNVAELKVA